MAQWLIAVLVFPSLASAASLEPGNWEFTVDMKAKGLGAFQPKPGPVTKTRCIGPDEAKNPAKVLSDAAGRGECEFSDEKDTGSEFSFNVRCTGRVPVQGSAKMQYTAQTIDGDIHLDGDAQGMQFSTRSHVTARRIGACTS
jgi:hypothetical protein